MPITDQDRHFIANGKKFKNYWRAYDELLGTQHNASPYLENDFFSNLKGLHVDPKIDYAKVTLEKIKEQFKDVKVNLLYSSGVDSHTILMKANQNKIKFNKVITIGRSLDDRHPNEKTWKPDGIEKYMKTQNYMYQQNTIDIMSHFRKDEWWYDDPSAIFCMDTHLTANPFWSNQELYITGHEKPYMLHHNGRWYVYIGHHAGFDSWHLENVIWFWGYNKLVPELLISQSRSARDYFTSKHEINETKFFGYKGGEYPGEAMSRYVNAFNDATGKIKVQGSTHNENQSIVNPAFKPSNFFMIEQLERSGNIDIWYKFLNDLKFLYHRHPQIDWDYPPFQPRSRMPWLLDIDSLEYIPGEQLGDMLKTK